MGKGLFFNSWWSFTLFQCSCWSIFIEWNKPKRTNKKLSDISNLDMTWKFEFLTLENCYGLVVSLPGILYRLFKQSQASSVKPHKFLCKILSILEKISGILKFHFLKIFSQFSLKFCGWKIVFCNFLTFWCHILSFTETLDFNFMS